MPSWPRRWRTAWPRRLRNFCTSASARNGVTARTKILRREDLIEEKYRGIRPAAGYPACPDHTEKADSLEAARRGKERRHQADGKFRHVAGQFGERTLFRASGIEILRRRQAGARPNSRLSSAQRHDLAGSRALAGPVVELRAATRCAGIARFLAPAVFGIDKKRSTMRSELSL